MTMRQLQSQTIISRASVNPVYSQNDKQLYNNDGSICYHSVILIELNIGSMTINILSSLFVDYDVGFIVKHTNYM